MFRRFNLWIVPTAPTKAYSQKYTPPKKPVQKSFSKVKTKKDWGAEKKTWAKTWQTSAYKKLYKPVDTGGFPKHLSEWAREPYIREMLKTRPKPKPKKDQGYTSKSKEGETTQEGGTDISDQLGPGTKFGSAAVDNSNFNYPYYFVQSFGKIGRNWSNPVAANQPLSCIIYFQIIRSGTVLDPEVEKSSGVTAFDRACLRAVHASSPLPPLPPDFRDDIIGIHLEFPYKPR